MKVEIETCNGSDADETTKKRSKKRVSKGEIRELEAALVQYVGVETLNVIQKRESERRAGRIKNATDSLYRAYNEIRQQIDTLQDDDARLEFEASPEGTLARLTKERIRKTGRRLKRRIQILCSFALSATMTFYVFVKTGFALKSCVSKMREARSEEDLKEAQQIAKRYTTQQITVEDIAITARPRLRRRLMLRPRSKNQARRERRSVFLFPLLSSWLVISFFDAKLFKGSV